MQSADAVVMPSAWEGFGRTHLEAAALGKVVVATDCPSGPAEIAAHFPGQFLLVPNRDESALAAALHAVIEQYNSQRLPAFPARVPHTFRPESNARAFRDLIESLDPGLG